MAVADFNDTFLRACRFEPTDYTPVWFMRQAGRYMPEYRALRRKHDVLTLTRTPELAAEISLQPVRTLGVDAAILFADIMLVPIAMGADVKIVDTVGPVLDDPIDSRPSIDRLHQFARADIEYLRRTIQILRGELKIPLIGFSGAPFTLASYLIEGAPSRTWLKTKRFMYEQPKLWHELMDKLAEAIIFFLHEQVDAGAQALQVFDSWVGALSPVDFREFVLPYNRRIFTALASTNVPRIAFGTDTAGILTDFADVDCEVVGLDWRQDLAQVRRLLPDKAVQGNLDPAVLASGWKATEHQAAQILASMPNRRGFIFNLGHGVWKEADPETLRRLVDYVHTH
ncbi:MAG TPA: uroporphyrinogen decarboxylase [Candidatus Saccharimonadia bacterium]|jgi:uroporphyrinogen decarboxylase